MVKYRIPIKSPESLAESVRLQFVAAARSWRETKWHHLGRDSQGLDCAGLIIVAIKDVLGVAPDAWNYSPWPDMKVMRQMCNLILSPIKREDMQPGDVALLYAPGVGVVHLGWYAGQTLIHASNETHAQKVVESTIHPDWNLRGSYRVPRFVGD